jgi:hypothetical protein
MAKNYTPIPGDKRPANAATFNNPLDQLDTKVGDVATLLNSTATSVVATIGTPLPTTTAQTVIGAINEHQTRIAGSIDADGTLKAGSVDSAAVLADNVVTAAKILDGALPSPNLAFDPYNRYLDHTVVLVDGLSRWYARPDCTIEATVVPANPYGLPTQRVASTKSGGRRFYLADMGVKVGDVLSFGTQAYVPTGASCRLGLAWRDAGAGSLGTAITGIWTGNNTVNLFVLEAQTVPATCTYVEVYIIYTSGSGVVDCYYWYVGRAQRAMLASTSQEDDGRRAMLLLEAAKGSMTSLDERLDVSLAADGSIGSAVNLAFDPLNRYYAPSASAQDGRLRWYQSSNLSQITPDANNPYNLPTIRATNSGGRRLYLDEMGIQVDSTGATTLDYVSFGLLLKAPVTRNFYLSYATRALDPTTIVTAASDTANLYTGTGALQLVTWNNRPIAADVDVNIPYSIDIYPNFHSGSGDIDIYGWYLVRGSGITTGTLAEGAWNGQRAEAWLQASTNSDGTLKASVAAPNDMAFGGQFLRDWQAQLAKVLLADASSQAVVAMIGDSWTNGTARLAGPLRTLLQTAYGTAGPGWVSATTSAKSETPTGVTRVFAGTWTERDKGTTPQGRGPDLMEMFSTDDAPAVGKVTFTGTFTDAKIHYLKQVDGATFRWQTDSDGWHAVDSAAGADALTVISMTGLSNASHDLAIEIVDSSSAGHAAGLVLFGVDMQITGNGVRLHKLGMSGAVSADWSSIPDATVLSASLTALRPNLAIISLGTNDDSADVAPATYIANIETVVARIRAALPRCDILYLSPADNGMAAGTYTMGDYVAVLRTSAADNDYAMFDAFQLLGSLLRTTTAVTGASNANPIVITAEGHGYAEGDDVLIDSVGGNTAANAAWVIAAVTTDTFELVGSVGNGDYTTGGLARLTRGLYTDTVHINATGGRIITGRLYRDLLAMD